MEKGRKMEKKTEGGRGSMLGRECVRKVKDSLSTHGGVLGMWCLLHVIRLTITQWVKWSASSQST